MMHQPIEDTEIGCWDCNAGLMDGEFVRFATGPEHDRSPDIVLLLCAGCALARAIEGRNDA